jgi:hypothetical protein
VGAGGGHLLRVALVELHLAPGRSGCTGNPKPGSEA